MADTALVVMARYPEVGKTKTRLARILGNTETISLYRAFLSDLAQRFGGQEYALHWAYTPAEVDYAAFVATLAPSYAEYMHCFPQQGTDLGERLHHVFQWTDQRNYPYTIVIGSDLPHMQREVIAHARAALNEADVVLGPSEDGGYYLIAMRKPYDVFSDIPMSTSVVMQQTIELADRQGLRVQLLETHFDVDEFSDLLRLQGLLATDSSLAPVTAAHLAAIRRLHGDYANRSSSDATTLDLH